jgi:hypothetical protein
MTQPPKQVHLNPKELVSESEGKATSMSLPHALHHRLDRLAELAKPARTSRGEIIAMLIADAPEDRKTLVQMLLDYRDLTIEEVLAQEERLTGDQDVVVQLRSAGRPSQKASN